MFERLLGRRALRVGETKASAAGPVVSLHVQGRPRWTPRDYAALAREGFMVNPVVHRAVRMISEAAAGAPLLLFEKDRAVDVHPLLGLIARPNPMQTGASLMEAAYAGLLIAGFHLCRGDAGGRLGRGGGVAAGRPHRAGEPALWRGRVARGDTKLLKGETWRQRIWRCPFSKGGRRRSM